MDTPGAGKGVRGVIIAAYGREFERLWASRSRAALKPVSISPVLPVRDQGLGQMPDRTKYGVRDRAVRP